MPEKDSGGALKEAGEGLKSILERIADFFDLFDLSFLVSGATTAAALSYLGWRARIELPTVAPKWPAFVGVLLILCYVLGLVAFAVGRWFRMGIRWRGAQKTFDDWFLMVIRGHGLDSTPLVEAYASRVADRGTWRLYVRMWAVVRSTPSLGPSYSLLRRYWVMAASYDGVATALAVWALTLVACAFGVGGVNPISKQLAIPSAVALAIASIACGREAGRYVKYQVEELVASIAAVEVGSASGIR